MLTAAVKQEIGAGRHIARHFGTLPGIQRSLALLDEIAAAEFYLPDVATNMPLALYGAGNLGHMAREFLKAVWLNFDFVVDRNADALKDHPSWQDKPIYSPEDVPEELKRSHQLLVTVATAPYVPLEIYLNGQGFENVIPFYDFSERFRHLHSLSNGWVAAPLSIADKSMAGAVLAGFADDISRAHYLQFLSWRRLRQEWTFTGADVIGSDRFFIPEVLSALQADEVFIDGGAHHGSVTLEFDRRRPDWKDILAIEPDPENRAILEKNFSTRWPENALRRPAVVEEALGAYKGSAAFHGGLGYASQLAAIGQLMADVTTIDALDVAPSFIKLHLEGGELDALKGGLSTLKTHRPVIVATVYHNDDGIWKTPLWMLESLENYRFLFRVHSWCGTGAVLYAIPAERANG
jgi:FkbM family methyltransferase